MPSMPTIRSISRADRVLEVGSQLVEISAMAPDRTSGGGLGDPFDPPVLASLSQQRGWKSSRGVDHPPPRHRGPMTAHHRTHPAGGGLDDRGDIAIGRHRSRRDLLDTGEHAFDSEFRVHRHIVARSRVDVITTSRRSVMDDAQLADEIWQARRERLIRPAPSTRGASLDIARAYRIQELVTNHRIAAGERVVGWKLGYTSQVMRDQMGIDEPNFGPLTDVMALTSGALAPAYLRQPRIEPEVALILGAEIPIGTPAERVVEFIQSARASLEVVDSSWTNYRFDLGDNTADSSSAGAFVLGDVLPLDDLVSVSVRLEITGEEPQSGTADAAMGNPLTALAWLVDQLGVRGEALPTGTVVLTGGLTKAMPLAPGSTASARFAGAEGSTRVVLHRAQS